VSIQCIDIDAADPDRSAPSGRSFGWRRTHASPEEVSSNPRQGRWRQQADLDAIRAARQPGD